MSVLFNKQPDCRPHATPSRFDSVENTEGSGFPFGVSFPVSPTVAIHAVNPDGIKFLQEPFSHYHKKKDRLNRRSWKWGKRFLLPVCSVMPRSAKRKKRTYRSSVQIS